MNGYTTKGGPSLPPGDRPGTDRTTRKKIGLQVPVLP